MSGVDILEAVKADVWAGVKHGIDIHNLSFQVWFVGTPLVWFGLVKYFRMNGICKFPTRDGSRTSDLLAFLIVAGISVLYIGFAGIILHMGLLGLSAERDALQKDMIHANSNFVVDHLVYPMVTFQLWNVLLCLFTPDLNKAEMIGHHLVTAALGYFGLRPYLHGYGVFFFGVAELTNVPLTCYDVFKYMKSAGWQETYPVLFDVVQKSFALSFLVVRLIIWPWISYPFWQDSIALLRSGTAHSNFVVGFFLVANIFLTGLQFVWGWMIFGPFIVGKPAASKEVVPSKQTGNNSKDQKAK